MSVTSVDLSGIGAGSSSDNYCESLGCESTVIGDGQCGECESATPIPIATSYAEIDWSKRKGGRIPRSIYERQQWMGATVNEDSQKRPFAPWGDSDHPEADDDTDARWKWGLRENYVTGGQLESKMEQSSSIEHRAFIQQVDDPFCHIDFDEVVDPDSGDVHSAVVSILNRIGRTFTEISQSETGIHGIYYGELPDDVRQAGWDLDDESFGGNDDVPSVEIYDRRRALVVTGNHVRGTPAGIHEWDADGLRELLKENDQLVETDVSKPSDDYEDFDVSEYEPEVTDRGETTDIHDVFAALNRLDAQDVAEETIVHQWNNSASTTDGKRAFKPTWGPNSNGTANYADHNIWNDTGGSGYGGPVVMALIDMGEVNPENITPYNPRAKGRNWFKGVEHLRDLGFDIPQYVDFTNGGNDSGNNTNPIPEPQPCEPPELKERVPFDADKERRKLEDGEYEAFIESSRPVVWSHPCGWGKTVSGIRGGDKRDRRMAMAFPTHKKAHESITDPNTPDNILHLKGGGWPKDSTCLSAAVNDRRCPEHSDGQCPLMCSLFERDQNDPLRQRFEQLKEVVGSISAHYHLDPHNGEKCEWLEQYDQLDSHDMVACVHEHQTLNKVRDERDILVDESTRLLKTEYHVCGEELRNAADVLEGINPIDRNYGELATFARRLAEGIRTGDGEDVDPPSLEWVSGTDVAKAETLASIRIQFNEHLRSRVEKGGDPPVKPGVIDVIIGFAASCGLDSDACGKALSGVSNLSGCPWCSSRLSNQSGRRVCENGDCGWTEGTDTYLPLDVGRERFVTHKQKTGGGRSEAVVTTIPNVSELPDSPLLLDATATPKKVEGLYGREPTVVGDEHDVAMNMEVTQISDGAYHGSSFTHSNTLVDRFQTIIDWACHEYDRPLFAAKEDILNQFEFADNAITEHYGALRGLNYDDCDAVFALGAPHWDIPSLKRDAELLSGGIAIDNGIEVGGIEYSPRRDNGELVANPPNYRRLQYVDEDTDDEQGLEMPVKEFSGLVGDLFYEKRENEIEQFVHRTRPITSDTTIDVYLLTNVVTDLPVDEVVELDTLIQQAKGRRKDIAQLDVPDGAKDLLETLDGGETFTRSDVYDRVDVSQRTAKKWVSSLMDEGAIGPTGEYHERSEMLTATN